MVLRYTSQNTNNIFTQSIIELCEHCDEKHSDVHISEILTKPDHLRDFTYTIKDASNSDYALKLKKERIDEIQVARMADGMITASEGGEFSWGPSTESLKYGLRSERMCSSSTNTDEEWCFRTENTKFLEKYSASFTDADRVTSGSGGGLKIGVGRTGVIHRLQSESIGTGDSITTKYHGPWEASWFRSLDEVDKNKKILEEKENEEVLGKIEDKATKEDWEAEEAAIDYDNNKAIAFDGIDDFLHAPEPPASFQFIQSSAWTISFWIHVGWPSTVNGSVHLISSCGEEGQNDNMWRVWYNESNNRLYFGFRSGGSNRSNNFWTFHSNSGIYATAYAAAGLGTTYWSKDNRGNTNARGFTNITIVKGTGVTAARSNVTAYWNGNTLGSSYYLSGNTNGDVAMDAEAARTFCIGHKAWQPEELTYAHASVFDEVGLWDTALSADQVTEIYNSGNPLNLTGHSANDNLIGYYRFEDTLNNLANESNHGRMSATGTSYTGSHS